MKILITTSNRGMVGGIEKYLGLLFPALLSRGHQVGLLYEHDSEPGRPVIEPSGAEIPVWRYRENEPGIALEEWKPTVIYNQGLESVNLEAWLLSRWPALMSPITITVPVPPEENATRFPILLFVRESSARSVSCFTTRAAAAG